MSVDLDEDDDILAAIKERDDPKKYVIPAGAPVLPSIVSNGRDAELVVNADGMAMVLYNKPLEEAIHWVEYDIDLAMLTFVTREGKVQGLGMKVHKPFRKYLSKAEQVLLIYMENAEQAKEIYPAKLVVRHVGI